LRHKKSEGEYLAFLCVKYEVNPDELFYALLSSGETGQAKCGNFLVDCRGKSKGKIIFLITSNSEVVAQFPVSENFLKLKGNPIRTYMETEVVRKQMAKRVKPNSPHLIRDLRVGMTHVNLRVKVLEVTKPKFVVTRYGNHASFAKAVISDETGQIKLCLWNEQIGSVSAEDKVYIENARVSAFRGERQLTLGKTGTLNNVELLNVDP
jgi:replication factor A1